MTGKAVDGLGPAAGGVTLSSGAEARHARVELEIEIRDHRISGEATVNGDMQRGFVGWLELVDVLEAAIHRSSEAQLAEGPQL